MKKLLLIAIAAMSSLVAMAETKTFTDQLLVSVDTEDGKQEMTQEATVTVEFLENGNINFVLKNFVLADEETSIGVGNIAVNDLPLTKGDNFDTFAYKGDLEISEGDLEGVDMWVGPYLGAIPLDLNGKITDEKVFVCIDIDMQESIGQIIHVEFGKDFMTEQTFTDQLLVSVDTEDGKQEMTQEASVIVQYLTRMNNSDPETINFTLPNFVLADEATSIGVGNIAVVGLELTEGKGFKTFAFKGDLLISEGDLEGVDMWVGPYLGAIPLDLNGKITDDKVFVIIDIDMQESIGQIIHVEFGQDIKPVYTVTYAIDGETIATEQVEEGGTVTLPEVPEKEGYTFAGWTGVPETVTADVTITGSYTVNIYTVYYKVDGRVVYSEDVAYGDPIPNFTITPQSDDRYTRTFEGWDGEHYDTMPAHDVTYEAIISVVDGIDNVQSSMSDAQSIYDLSGRRVAQPKKGLYIKNGRVVVLK